MSKIFIFILINMLIVQADNVNKIRVSYKECAKKYITDFKLNESSPHRSGIIKSKPVLFDGIIEKSDFPIEDDRIDTQKNVHAKWVSGYHCEYLINNEIAPNVMDWFTIKCNNLGLNIDKKGDECFVRYDLENYQRGEGNGENLQLQKQNLIAPSDTQKTKDRCYQIIRENFSGLKGRLEYECSDIIYQDDLIKEIHFRFRRIYKGGILAGNLSFMYMSFDCSEKLFSVQIKWPQLIKKNNMEYSSISLEKAEEIAIDICSNPPSSKLMNGESVNPVSIVIDGVSMGWRKNISNAKEFIITPCYLFKAVVELENGNKTKRFLQIPRLSKYIP